MPIPAFDADGILTIPDPPGGPVNSGHVSQKFLSTVPVTLAEVHDRFVSGRSDESHRQGLWDKWEVLRAELQQVGLRYVTWISGSFTTDKQLPGDIDVLLIIDATVVASLTTSKQAELLAILSEPDPKARYGCDLYYMQVFPTYDPAFFITCLDFSYWTRVYGVTRDGKQRVILHLPEGT
jgi:hypothetical protein